MAERILVIRRDNIGDLVCTTPLFSALRRHYPNAYLAALVNSYNAPVLAGNHEINQVYVYRKAKHREPGESKFGIWWQTWRLMQHLRQEHFDLAIVATPAFQPEALKFAHWVGAKRILAYGRREDGISDPVSLEAAEGHHETEAVMRLLHPLGIHEPPGPLAVAPPSLSHRTVHLPAGTGPLIGLHISARKAAQRWSTEHFAALAKVLHAQYNARFLVFWAPGSQDHPQHPGDDEKAEHLRKLCENVPLLLFPTSQLDDLIAGLACCDYIICSDGGGMHLAAGLGKPIVCFFGNSSGVRWHPWGVPYELLQKPSQVVADIDVTEVVAAFERLISKC